jgi:hypothetical protein
VHWDMVVVSALGSDVPWPSFLWKKDVSQCKPTYTTNQRRLQTSRRKENGGPRSPGSNVILVRVWQAWVTRIHLPRGVPYGPPPPPSHRHLLSLLHPSYTRTQDRLVPFWLKVDFRQNGLLFDPPTIPNGTFQIRSGTCSGGRGTSSKVRIAGGCPCSARCRHSHKLTPIT